MLKWTLKNPGDAPTPPPPQPPDNSYHPHHQELSLNLKDSNQCWLETQVKVAQVRSTTKIVENGNVCSLENGKLEQGKENDSVFRRWMTQSRTHADDDKKRKRHHKHTRCNPLDPLRLFSGEVTDSDTGSVYMQLQHTPAALQPRPHLLPTTGPSDPRRKPLVDISNGDYSDLRKHLQHISASQLRRYHHHHSANPLLPLHHQHSHRHQHPIHYEHPHTDLPHYLQQFTPSYSHHHQHSYHQHTHHHGNDQRVVGVPGHSLARPDTLGASASQINLRHNDTRHSRSSSSSRSRSSSMSQSRPLMAVNSSLFTNTTINTNTNTTITSFSNNNSSRGSAEGQSQSMLQEGLRAPHAFKRHSIADIPTEASFRGVWETQKERRGRSSSHERKRESSRDRSVLSRFCRDKTKDSKLEGREGCESKLGKERVEGRRASREKSRKEPIYEKVGNGDASSANTSSSSVSSKRGKVSSGSSINSRKSQNSFDNAIYMSMKDLRAHYEQLERKHSHTSLPLRISPDPNKTPVFMRDHLYENMLYLPMTEIKSALKKPLDRSRPLPEPPCLDEHDLDNTCDFTSEPQKDVHKPVAIKISEDLIARFGKSPNDRQHPMPHYGLYIATHPSKKPCATENGKNSDPHKVFSDIKQVKVYKSTGQHVHINYKKQCDPSLPLYNLRPPPPPPRKPKSSHNSSNNKTKHRPKSQTKPKSDIHLPVIYENTRQEENLSQSAKKRKLRHSMEIEFSFDDDVSVNRCCDRRRVTEISPRGGNISSSDNPDSGVSEGITTPLVSPLSAPGSPETPRSDSLLEESYTPLSLEELHTFKENGVKRLTRENDVCRNSAIFANMCHNITDPSFLESFLKDEPNSAKSSVEYSSVVTEASVDGIFNHTSPMSLQQTNSSISFSNVNSLYQTKVECKKALKNNKIIDVSKMILNTVERNLFSDSTNKISAPHRDTSAHNTSLSRRHSFSGLVDISRRLSSIGFSDDTSLWGMEVSDHNESTLKKAKSLHCLSPSTFSPRPSNVPLMDSMAEILKDPELRVDSRGYSRLLANSEQMNLNTSEQSEHWWLSREEEEDLEPPIKGSGRAGGGCDGQSAHPGSFTHSPAIHHHPNESVPDPHSPTLRNPTLALPVEMSGEQHLATGYVGACYSVPSGLPSSEDISWRDVTQCSSVSVDVTVLPGVSDQLTTRQKRRQEESSYRLQRMIQDCAQPPQETDADESVSADWSMEAVVHEVSIRDHQDLDGEISFTLGCPDSPDSQDVISLCTLDSDYADSIYLGRELCEKIKQISEDKMLARLRKSFRSKKDKRCTNPTSDVEPPITSAPPKVGILMFVDNPMYLSPEVKKEAKIVSAQNNDHNNLWYVGNPMYNSPEPNKLRNFNYDTRQKFLCEKENIRNTRLANVVSQNVNNRKPLSSIWHQSNPCYESPEAKTSHVKMNNLRISASNSDDTYLTPIPVKHARNYVPRPTIVSSAKLADDKDILDRQKFLDHEYCTIPGDDSDSWVSQSTTSRKSDSPVARRSLEFSAKNKKTNKAIKASLTPSRMWRQTSKTQHSTPRKYQGTLEKNLDSGMPLGTRTHRTLRTVKRGKKNKDTSQNTRDSSCPPPLPARPHPLIRHYENDMSVSALGFEDTNDFHHRGLENLDDSSKFQLPPDGIYESISSVQGRCSRGLARSASYTSSHKHDLDAAFFTGSSSACSSPRSSRTSRSGRCSSGTKNVLGGSLCEGSLKVRSRKTATTKRITKKYRARDVLQGKGKYPIMFVLTKFTSLCGKKP
nr:uncharacterized protein LOC128688914 [Cherax quadricarinatus]